MAKLLWISGRLPTPLYSGDALYSAGLITACIEAGAKISLIGTRREGHDSSIYEPLSSELAIIPIDGPTNNSILSVASTLPKDAYILATRALRQAVRVQLESHWDWIVVDHANSSGLLPLVLELRRSARVCYIAHNAESLTRPAVASAVPVSLRRLALHFDAQKYRRLEDMLSRQADTIICISDSDANFFSQFGKQTYIVPPVFLGSRITSRTIAFTCPRQILLVGSFDWIAKQRNLIDIVETICPIFDANSIILAVVGAVPGQLRAQLSKKNPRIRFLGRSKDLVRHSMTSRGGLVAEVIGGGFKLKILDYAFNRVPIFGLTSALSGTTKEERDAMYTSNSLADLAHQIARNIDDLTELNNKQNTAYDLFDQRFSKQNVSCLLKAAFTA